MSKFYLVNFVRYFLIEGGQVLKVDGKVELIQSNVSFQGVPVLVTKAPSFSGPCSSGPELPEELLETLLEGDQVGPGSLASLGTEVVGVENLRGVES